MILVSLVISLYSELNTFRRTVVYTAIGTWIVVIVVAAAKFSVGPITQISDSKWKFSDFFIRSNLALTVTVHSLSVNTIK